MPKLPRELSPIEISRLKNEGVYAVGGVPGLYLQIIGGSRAWVLRFVVGAQRRRMGLGGFPAVTLAQARDKARAARELMDQGIDPIQSRQAVMHKAAAVRARALTFSKASEKFIASREAEWRNPKHRQQWVNTLATYADPVIGEMDVADIDQRHIMLVLDPIWRTKTETASRLRGRIEQILDWAAVRKHRSGENPARWTGHLDKLLPKPSKISTVKHHPAVEIGEAPAVVRRIEASAGMGARALLLQVLTGTRSGEVRGALWEEFDLDGGVWNIPKERMKSGRPHRVSLSRQAVQLLRDQPRFEGAALVFPSSKMTLLSDMSLTAVMRRLKLDAVPHGFRSTFSDWAAECTSHPRDLVEMALAHAIDSKVEAAYRRGDMLAKRATLMQAWADYCLPQPPG